MRPRRPGPQHSLCCRAITCRFRESEASCWRHSAPPLSSSLALLTTLPLRFLQLDARGRERVTHDRTCRPGLRTDIPQNPDTLAAVRHVDVAARVDDDIGAVRDIIFAAR